MCIVRGLQIGEFGRLLGIAPHVLRHWEAVGVLPPPIRKHGRRLYHHPHVKRVAIIVCAQTAGLGLTELREILETPTASARREKLEKHLVTLTTRIAQLEEAKRTVEAMHAWPGGDFSECPIFAQAVTTILQRPADIADQSPRLRGIDDSAERNRRKKRS